MKKLILYGSWFCLYVICSILGYIVPVTTVQQVSMLILALTFFVPPAMLLIDAYRQQDKKTFLILRWISAGSLVLSVIFLVLNVMSALFSEAAGELLYELLIFVSAPMICSQHWMLSLFLWACLFFATIGRKKKK